MVMFRGLDKIIFRSILTQVFFKTTTLNLGAQIQFDIPKIVRKTLADIF